MPDQEKQVHSVEWAESLFLAQASIIMFANKERHAVGSSAHRVLSDVGAVKQQVQVCRTEIMRD